VPERSKQSQIRQPLTGNGIPYIIPDASDYHCLISFQEDHKRLPEKLKMKKQSESNLNSSSHEKSFNDFGNAGVYKRSMFR